MAKLEYVRNEISPAARKILQDAANYKITEEEGAKLTGEPIEEFKKAVNLYRKMTTSTAPYSANVQKMISFKGTVREMTLQARNRKGGTYPLKVINLYMKPNTERYYEEKAYPVDKELIRKGSESEGFHPNKALWANITPQRVRPKVEKPSTPLEGTGPSGEIILRKKGKSKGRMKLRKKSCKCAHKRK